LTLYFHFFFLEKKETKQRKIQEKTMLPPSTLRAPRRFFGPALFGIFQEQKILHED
jgi:hypothetical protein